MGSQPVQIINAPFDLCGRMPGSRLGPAAVHLAGLRSALTRLGWQVAEAETGWNPDHALADSPAENALACLDRCLALKGLVRDSLAQGSLPLVIGGDHSLSMGSISGALAAEGEALGVLWVDAHMDLNTPSSSASMNLHGMPLAALLKLGDTQFSEMNAVWSRLQAEVVEGPGLPPSHVSWLGLRDVDEGEAVNFRTLPGALAITMQTIDHEGLAACIRLLEDWIWQTGIKRLWISFDVDSMDPLYAPGTGTAVRGGLTYREGHYLAECLHKTLFTSGSFCTLAGLDVVEVNPLLDRNNETARMAVGWVESLFGRQILREEI